MRKNLLLKAASVLFAVGLWIFVISKGQSEILIEAPVVFENIPAGYHIEEQSDRMVLVGLKGHIRFIKNLSPEDVNVYVNVSGVKSGKNVVNITVNDVRVPMSLRVVSVKPLYLDVIVEETVKKAVHIEPLVMGEPREGFVVKKVVVEPSEANVEGPNSEISALSVLGTEAVDVSDADSTVKKRVLVLKPYADLNIGVKTVEVKVVIERRRG